MKFLKLTQGEFAQVDDFDYEYLNQFKWCVMKLKNTSYAVRAFKKNNGIRTTIYLHREIMKARQNQLIDHADRNGLNCQRNNLRFATNSENSKNRICIGYCGLLGVSVTKNNRYYARIRINGKQKRSKTFISKEDAGLWYNNMAIKHHGEFARPNLI